MKKQSKGFIYLCITVVLFSTFEVAGKLAGTSLHPLQISFLRFMLGGLVLLPFAALSMKKHSVKLTLRLIAETSLTGFVNIVVSMGLIQYGLLYTSASTSAVIFSSNPVFVALFAWLILHERIDRSKIIGMIVGIAGVVILFSDKLSLSLATAEGPLMVIGSAVTFALYTVLGKKLTMKGTDSLVMTSLSFITGSLMLLPAMLIMKIPVFAFDTGLIPLILYLGIVVSGIAYMSYFYGLANINTSTGALIYFIKPVLAALFSVIILHETLNASFYTGTAVITGGLAVVNARPLVAFLKARAAGKITVNPEVVELCRRGNEFRATQEYESAVVCYKRAIQIDPEMKDIHIFMGNVLFEMSRFEEAISCYDTYLNFFPDNVSAINKKGNAYDMALSLDSDFAPVWSNKANALFLMNKPDEAIRCCNKALELDPDFPDAWYGKGFICAESERYEEARNAYLRLLELEPATVPAICELCKTLCYLEDYDNAVSWCQKALEYAVDNADVWHTAGYIMESMEKYKEASECFDKALELDDSHLSSFFHRGEAYRNLGKFEEAISDYEYIILRDPDYAPVYERMAGALYGLGDFQEAIEYCDRALELDPELADAFFGKSSALCQLSLYHEAVEILNQLLALDPNYLPAWNLKGVALFHLDCCNEALETFSQVLALDPSNADACYNTANVMFSLNEYDEALKYYDKALELNPDYSEAWYGRGNVFEALGENDKAAFCFEKAAELGFMQEDEE